MTYPWINAALRDLIERRDRLPHALLFRGREGIGKLALAEALARAILCERPGRGGDACGQCAACAWMGQGSHPDFRRLEPDSLAEQGEPDQESERKGGLQIPVAKVRELAQFINVSSHRGGAKVVLIHPAEALNVNAANALLKSLEEPPPRTYFLLVAHRWHHLPATVRSRCEQLSLPVPPLAVARDWLAQQRKLPDPDLALAQAGGAPLLALTFDDDYWRQRETLLAAITAPEPDALIAAEQLRDSAPSLIVGLLQKWSFDLVWHKVTGGVRYNPDRVADVAAAAARLGLLAVLRYQRRVVGLQRIAAHPLNTRLFLEQLLLEYLALLRAETAESAS